MSKGFIVSTTGNTRAFAYIDATYPEGSVCTCTNGEKTYSAKNTSGHWVFSVNKTGTWTVSCTNGDKSKSVDVEITEEGQSATVKLSYELVLYAAGDDGTNWQTYKSDSAGSVSFQATQIYLNSSYPNGIGYSNSSLYFKQSFAGGEFETLTFRTGSTCDIDISGGVGVVTASNLDTVHNASADPTTAAKVTSLAANKDYSLDLSKLTEGETYYFAAWVRGRNTTSKEYSSQISIASMIAT